MIPAGWPRTLRNAACAWALGAAVAASAGCELQGGYAGDYYAYPPDAYIATTEPVYFEGRANYWYGGNWYYRGGGGRWNHYDREPSALYQRRIQAPPARRNYERFAGHPPAARAPAPARGGGWRGDHR